MEEYTIKQVSDMAGVSTRTLRYYEQVGLLCPRRRAFTDYRLYGTAEIDLLQQILFYREMGLRLDEIAGVLHAPAFDRRAALEKHKARLLQERQRLDRLLATVEKTIKEEKGEAKMQDKEKFEGFKKRLLDENEARYGAEIREKYGEETVEAANAKFAGMSEEEYVDTEKLAAAILEKLRAAMETGDPKGEATQEVCALHKRWLCRYWSEYSAGAHYALAQQYVDDERFRAYYDVVAPGAAEFLRDALKVYTGQ